MKCKFCQITETERVTPIWWTLTTESIKLVFCCLECIEKWLATLPYGDERDEGKTFEPVHFDQS